jgi:phage tail protein X
MSGQRSILDRAMRWVAPTAVRSFAPPPRQLSDGLWIVDRRLSLPPGLILPTRMTIMRLASGALALHSPVALDADLATALRSLGDVVAIIAPNTFHYVFAADYVAAFPAACLFAAPGLAERVPSLPAAVPLSDEAAPLWMGVLDQIVLGPVRGVSEVVFLHRPSRTLVLTDLAFNMSRIDGLRQRVAWRLFGVPPSIGPSRSARLILLRDPTLVRRFVEQVSVWSFERIIVAHGEIVEHKGGAEFRRAFARYC